MDKESLLTKLNSIQSNNTIIQLETKLEAQRNDKNKFAEKSKDMLKEVMQMNTRLIHQKAKLQKDYNSLQKEHQKLTEVYENNLNIINKIPRFLLKIFSKKAKILLLNEGISYEEKYKKTKFN